MGHGGSFHHLSLRDRVAGSGTDVARSSSASSPRPLTAAADNSPSFWDFLDVVNPLQHIPVISSIYRNLTGDQIGGVARTIGGALFGGPLGLVASVFENMVQQTSGKDFGEQIASLLGGDGDKPIDGLDTRTALAKASADTPQASGDPLDLNIRPSDIPRDIPRDISRDLAVPSLQLAQNTAVPQAEAMVAAPPVVAPPAAVLEKKAVTAPVPESSVPQKQAVSGPPGTFMPLNDKVRHVARGVKFRTVPGLSSSRVFNPKNEKQQNQEQAAVAVPAVTPPPALDRKQVNQVLDQAAQTQTRQNFPQSTPPVDISTNMLKALEKYQAMQRLGQPAGSASGSAP